MQKHQTLLIHDSQITGVSLMESFTFFLNWREIEKKLYDYSCHTILGTETMLNSIAYVFVRLSEMSHTHLHPPCIKMMVWCAVFLIGYSLLRPIRGLIVYSLFHSYASSPAVLYWQQFAIYLIIFLKIIYIIIYRLKTQLTHFIKQFWRCFLIVISDIQINNIHVAHGT